MAKKKQEFPIHKIRTLGQLMKVLNEKNVDMVMGNFYGCVKAFLHYRSQGLDLIFQGFDWIDDGKLDIREPSVKVSKKFKVAVKEPSLKK